MEYQDVATEVSPTMAMYLRQRVTLPKDKYELTTPVNFNHWFNRLQPKE